MPDALPSTVPAVRRIRSDPMFYAIFGLIGGTYVALIVLMLLADAAYMVSSDMHREVVLDFATDGDGNRLETGDPLEGRFAHFGLTITTEDETQRATILDSNRPSAANSRLGTPHQDMGGPGFGKGGRQGQAGENLMPLGNVVIVSENDATATHDADLREFVLTWVTPVTVESLRVEGEDPFAGTLAGEIATYGNDGQVIARHKPRCDEHGRIAIGDEGVARMDVTLPVTVSNTVASYHLRSDVATNMTTARRTELKLGNVRVVPDAARSIASSSRKSQVTFHWEDPIHLGQLRLLNVTSSGGAMTAFDANGRQIAQRELAMTGPNGIESIRVDRQGVARLQIDLPAGAAVAELTFHWLGHVRSAWQREYPLLGRIVYNPITAALAKPEIQYSIRLSLISCTMTAILSLWVAIPIGYLLSRHKFPGRNMIDAILDIPIVLPPLVVGLSLLILFQFLPESLRNAVVYQIPAVVLAQFSVACAFAVRTMKATFDHIDARQEQVALTLGCSRAQAFGLVVLPEARRGILTAGTLAWARALGEFGPLLIFAGTTRMRTEVLSTTVYLEMSIGDIGAAVAVSLIMVAAAVFVLVLARLWGTRSLSL